MADWSWASEVMGSIGETHFKPAGQGLARDFLACVHAPPEDKAPANRKSSNTR